MIVVMGDVFSLEYNCHVPLFFEGQAVPTCGWLYATKISVFLHAVAYSQPHVRTAWHSNYNGTWQLYSKEKTSPITTSIAIKHLVIKDYHRNINSSLKQRIHCQLSNPK
jgi:hypothetical protein